MRYDLTLVDFAPNLTASMLFVNANVFLGGLAVRANFTLCRQFEGNQDSSESQTRGKHSLDIKSPFKLVFPLARWKNEAVTDLQLVPENSNLHLIRGIVRLIKHRSEDEWEITRDYEGNQRDIAHASRESSTRT